MNRPADARDRVAVRGVGRRNRDTQLLHLSTLERAERLAPRRTEDAPVLTLRIFRENCVFCACLDSILGRVWMYSGPLQIVRAHGRTGIHLLLICRLWLLWLKVANNGQMIRHVALDCAVSLHAQARWPLSSGR